jgi:hypothetical protein
VHLLSVLQEHIVVGSECVLENCLFFKYISEPTTICSCKTDNKCTAKAHGQNEYSELKER